MVEVKLNEGVLDGGPLGTLVDEGGLEVEGLGVTSLRLAKEGSWGSERSWWVGGSRANGQNQYHDSVTAGLHAWIMIHD